MPDMQLLLLARDLRVRAEGLLARAETFYDPNARQMMHTVATRYETLAQRLETNADDADKL
jgi:hypothetical protein